MFFTTYNNKFYTENTDYPAIFATLIFIVEFETKWSGFVPVKGRGNVVSVFNVPSYEDVSHAWL